MPSNVQKDFNCFVIWRQNTYVCTFIFVCVYFLYSSIWRNDDLTYIYGFAIRATLLSN